MHYHLFAANSDLPVRNLAEEISKVDCSGEKSKGQINITSSLIINPQKETAGNLRFNDFTSTR